jgi:hypothetical protein
MIYKHEKGCPFEGLSMTEANGLYRKEQRTDVLGSNGRSYQESQPAADASAGDPAPDDTSATG